VSADEAANLNIHAAFVKFESGQLPFLGLCPRPVGGPVENHRYNQPQAAPVLGCSASLIF
jgi:hypothetical protein